MFSAIDNVRGVYSDLNAFPFLGDHKQDKHNLVPQV
jgi:hypothetical protein